MRLRYSKREYFQESCEDGSADIYIYRDAAGERGIDLVDAEQKKINKVHLHNHNPYLIATESSSGRRSSHAAALFMRAVPVRMAFCRCLLPYLTTQCAIYQSSRFEWQRRTL